MLDVGPLYLDLFSGGQRHPAHLDTQLQHPVGESGFRQLQLFSRLGEALFVQHLRYGPFERPADALFDVEHLFGLPDDHAFPFLRRPADPYR